MDLAKESLEDLIYDQEPKTGVTRYISFRRKMEIAAGIAKGMTSLHLHPNMYMYATPPLLFLFPGREFVNRI